MTMKAFQFEHDGHLLDVPVETGLSKQQAAEVLQDLIEMGHIKRTGEEKSFPLPKFVGMVD